MNARSTGSSATGSARTSGPAARLAAMAGALRLPARPSNASLAACAAGALLLSGSVLWLGVPALRRAESRAIESGRLHARAAQLEAATLELDEVRREVERVRAANALVRRVVPREPDQGALMRMLAIGAGPDVGTQTIVAGESVPATPSSEAAYRAVPVTVDMQATFARVMDILARAESAPRLVRPIRIEIARPLEGPRGAAPTPEGFVEARLELDAVYADATRGGTER